MSHDGPDVCPRPRSTRPGAFFVAALLVGLFLAGVPDPTLAQVPDTIPPPTLPDTVPPEMVPPDTVPPGPVVEDTLPPEPPEPAILPPLPRAQLPGGVQAVWEWGRDDLLRLPDLSLLHLLERIPGITPVRATPVGQPEGAAVFGSTAGAIRYELDGYLLDPLTAPTFDPARIPLVALENVRVERRVTGATVRLRSLTPTDPRHQSSIEAGTGDLGTNLFRGTFLAPRILDGALALGFENLASRPTPGLSSTHTAGFLKWTWTREDAGVQVEYRQSTMDRVGVGPGVLSTRRDWVARGRHRFGPIHAEAYAGGSSIQEEVGQDTLREGTPQGGVRLRADAPFDLPVHLGAAARFRDNPRLPNQELELSAWGQPAPFLGLGGEMRRELWPRGPGTTSWSARAQAGPLLGVTGFVGGSSETRALPFADGRRPLLEERGLRAGGELSRGSIQVAAALVRIQADSVPGFGLAFDPGAPRFPGGEATGIEAWARLPTGWAPLRLEGWYVGLDAPATWPYLPAERWKAALHYHDFPLPTENLEIYFRAEHELRTAMTVPQVDDPGLATVGAYRATNLELTIRVLDVRAFMRWQNIFNRPFQEDLPNFRRPGQHIVYGVKWNFWN